MYILVYKINVSGQRLLRRKKVLKLRLWLTYVEESIKECEKGLDSKVKLAMYKTFGKNISMELVILGQDFCLKID